MTSSNKARRYLQHQKQNSSEYHNNQQSSVQLLVDDSALPLTSMRKFRGKTQQQSSPTVSIPQICVNNNDDDDDINGHIAVLNAFDQVLENELKCTSVLRTLSLKQTESNEHIGVPIQQQRSFSFALGSKTNLLGKKHTADDHDDDDELMNSLPSKTMKLSATSKSSLSKETFLRLFHSLTFRSGNHSTSKLSVAKTDSQNPCLACQNYPDLHLISKNKKRPSIFGVFVSKLNTSNETTPTHCSICKRLLSKSISNNDDNQQSSSSKHLRDQKQLFLHIKRRQSLPSLFHNLLESSSSSVQHHRPLFSSILNNNLIENINLEQKQSVIFSQSSTSLTESDDSNDNNSFQRKHINYDDSFQLTEKCRNKDENDNEILFDSGESHDLNSMHSNDSTFENNTNQQFLHPPEEKTRNLLINVFRTRRSNIPLGSNETTMVGKQFSVSVSNLATTIATNRRNSAIATINESTLDQRKHAVSEENLPSMDNTYIYFNNIHGENFKEKLKYSTTSENTTLKEMLIKLFEKHHLSIDMYNICLRNAPTLPLSLDQPVKHLLLDDLVVTETTNANVTKISNGKERNEKRNSTGSAMLPLNFKPASKRLSSHCMMLDIDDNQDSKSPNPQHNRTTKPNRTSIFTGSIFTRDASDLTERSESNLSFLRRKCDEWLIHGLPKLAQLQYAIDECDLIIEKEWQPFLPEQTLSLMSETIKLQQETIYEMLSTEVSYIRQLLTMIDIFMTSVSILKSSQRDGIFNDIDLEKLFSNIQDVLHGNLLFWKEILLPMKLKLEQSGLPMNPSDLKNGFMNFDLYFKSYLHYVLDQKSSAEYFKQKLSRDDLFQYLVTWIEANFTNRLSFSDLTIKPLQRLTRYKLLLEAIQKKTHDLQQRNDLHQMIEKVATFVNRINSKLHKQEQEERVHQINDRIGPFENVPAPPELTSILQEYNRDSMSNRLDLLQDIPLHVRGYRRQIIQQGPMRMKDSKNSQDVYCYLFTDMFLITKGGKRSGSTNSSLSSTNNDSQSNRTTSNILNKILKPPIRIDRIDVREYDRRGGSNANTEPNTASFVALIFSEYNLIESGYLFQTNLSKQWIENIRTAKATFQLLMEESKLKFQNLHKMMTASCSSVSTNTIHQSLPSLSSPSLELPLLKINETTSVVEDARRSSKVESDVFKIVEQTRRNSRTDRKNFGRYFTADGTSTHTTNSPSSPIKQISSSSTAIIKRMSWNNEKAMEKTDSSLITNSFRSVHSSSGVSSTGSFLFSTDEDSSMTTTTSSSVPSMIPSTKNEEFDGTSLTSTVIGRDNQIVQSLSSQEQNSTSENDLENKNNQQLITHSSSSSTCTLISNNQTIAESAPLITTYTSSPESSLRRTPYASIKKRNHTHHQQGHRRHKIFIDNDTPTTVYNSPKFNDDHPTINSPDNHSSLIGSGNESDYDNHQCTAIHLPVNNLLNSDELTRTDDLLLGDQNEIILNNNTPIENLNQQSDITRISSTNSPHRTNIIATINTTATLDDSVPTNFLAYRKDSLIARRLLDIRSHLLLNTTLDATEV